MCRWIAYRGRSVSLATYITEPSHSLISQSHSAKESASPTNGDGIGLGWFGEYPEPGLYRDVRPAWSDDNLTHLCRHIRSHLFFGHVRAATGTPVTRTNCHPFSHGRWLFMHNGFVGRWQDVRRKVESLIPDHIYRSRLGTTDSEALFLSILGAEPHSDPVGAVAKVVTTVSGILDATAPGIPFRFSAALSDGKQLLAFRYAHNDCENSLYYQQQSGGLIVASEPLDPQDERWREIPSGHVLIDASDSVGPRLVPFMKHRQLAAA